MMAIMHHMLLCLLKICQPLQIRAEVQYVINLDFVTIGEKQL
jgi:hypothetical protein